MVFWVSEEFPPIEPEQPKISMSKGNIFSGNISTLSLKIFIFYWLLFADGEMKLEVSLGSNVYRVGQPLSVNVTISSHPPRYFITTKYHETSKQISRRVSSVKVAVVQAVDVTMFASGSFKVFIQKEQIYFFYFFSFSFKLAILVSDWRQICSSSQSFHF